MNMNSFFDWVIHQRVFILIAFLGLCVFSLATLNQLNLAAVPDVTNKQVVINTKTKALSHEQVELTVTYPIEVSLTNLPKVIEVRSLTKYGLSQVTVVFEDDVDLYFARQMVSEKLQAVRSSLPSNLQPELGPMTTGLGEVLMWTLSFEESAPQREQLSPTQQLQELRRIQDYVIRPRLLRLSGVAEIDSNGGYNSEIHINYFPDRLVQFGIAKSEIISALSQLGVSFSGGYIRHSGQHINVFAKIQGQTLDDLKQFPIKILPTGHVLRLEELAEIRIDHALRVGSATAMGEEVVLGTLLMRTGADSRRVSKEGEDTLAAIELPEGVNLRLVYNRKTLVDQVVRTLQVNLGEGALLVILILFFLLGSFRAALLVSLAIPISALFALTGMRIFGISANLMSLGAIDFGLLVDGSVVLVENFLRRWQISLAQSERPLSIRERLSLIADSSREVAPPVIFGLFIIILVYTPLLALEGVEGKMFEPMAITVMMALAASLLVAVFLIPGLIAITFNKSSLSHKPSVIFDRLLRGYEKTLSLALRWRWSILVGAFSLFVFSAYVFTQLGSDFIPRLKEGILTIGVVRDPTQDIEGSTEWQLKTEKLIQSVEGVIHVFSRIGTPESATDPMGPNFADAFVFYSAESDENEIVAKIREKFKQPDFKDNEILFTQPIEMRLNELLEGSRADLSLRILGSDLDQLSMLAEKIQPILRQIQGVASAEFDSLTGLARTAVLEIAIRPEKAAFYGISSEMISRQVEMDLAGVEVGYRFVDGVRLPIVFHLDESLRNSPTNIERLLITDESLGQVSLSELASLSFDKKVTTIARYWGQRYSALSVDVADRDLGSVVEEAKTKIAREIQLPQGYSLEWSGQYKNLERAQKRLGWLLPLTMAGIFVLIFFVIQSLAHTFAIFLAIPFGLMGGVASLSLRGLNFSVSAAVGFIALSGIVILNSLVLVTFIQNLKKDGRTIENAILEGCKARLRPVLTTALVAGLGFLPMALNTGMGAEVQRPLATVVIGGLLTSTLLTLIAVPALLSLLDKKRPS